MTTYKNAVKNQLKIYSGRKCKNGHDGERYTTTRSCVQCCRERYNKNKKDPEFLRVSRERSQRTYKEIISTDAGRKTLNEYYRKAYHKRKNA